MDKKLSDKALEELRWCHSGDIEIDHQKADEVLTDLLKKLGYHEVVESYENVEKWFA